MSLTKIKLIFQLKNLKFSRNQKENDCLQKAKFFYFNFELVQEVKTVSGHKIK